MKSASKIAPVEIFALVFGLFLGLCIIKFGNPVILDHKILTPQSLADAWNDGWPTHWTPYFIVPLLMVSIFFILKGPFLGLPRWYWVLPLAWFGWQLFSSKTTVAADLTSATLWQYAGCLVCYFTGALLFSQKNTLNLLLVGILATSAYCLVRAMEQRVYEFPTNHEVLVEGEQSGWTNMPPAAVAEMKQEQIIITTNGVDIANPVILTKMAKGRVYGTLVYPNALAGLILMLFPLGLTVAIQKGQRLRPAIRWLALIVVSGMGLLSFIWTGSKLGWLLAIVLVGIYLLNLGWSVRLKIIAVALVFLIGLGVFGLRFHSYFAKGATSMGARFDYWRAAVKTTATYPLSGTGPGTFQRPYESWKSPEAEMARLAHNDYLEQFSDSGLPGGVFYCLWISLCLWAAGRRIWGSKDLILFGIFVGLLGWYLQGVGEFSLFIPATAWVAFTLLGVLIGQLRINSTEKWQ